jgi:sporulation protein YlmC with PRC-barrel domain
MIRSLMASTALLALVTTGALAQQQPADQTQMQPPEAQQPADQQQMQAQEPAQQPASGDMVRQTQEPGEILVDDLVGETVYSGRTEDAETIGDIQDLVLDQDGSVTAVVVGIGGFLGIGRHDVAINFEELEFTQDENGELMVVVNATREQLEAMPEFEETDQRLYGGLTDEERGTTRLPERERDQQAAEQPEQQPQDQQLAEQPEQQPQDQQVAEQPEQQPQDQQAAEQPEQQPQDQMAQQPQDQMAQQPEQQMAAGETRELRFLEAGEPGVSRASEWIGEQVVTPEGEEIGEVQDILLDESGMAESIIVDVSGFLETEKQVAMPFDSLQVEQQEGEEVRLVATLSREELEQAPAYQAETGFAAGQEQPQDQQLTEQQDLQAQDQTAQQPQDQQPAEQQDQMAQQPQDQQLEGTQQALGAGEILADDLIGETVYSGQGEEAEEIGQISDLVVGEQGEISAAVIGVGGFLGIGERDVAIDFEQLHFTQDQDGELRIVADMTREQLEQAQAFEDSEQTQLYGELSDEQRSTARMPDRQAEGERMAAGEQQPAATGEAQERQAARAPGVEPGVSGLSADELMGADVIGANNEEIGQVGDVIFSQDGQVRAVIVDVGGLLGIGAKEVAIEFESAEVRRDGDQLALVIHATEEQLEQAPEWQETAALQDGQQQPQAEQPAAEQQPAEQPPAERPAQQ